MPGWLIPARAPSSGSSIPPQPRAPTASLSPRPAAPGDARAGGELSGPAPTASGSGTGLWYIFPMTERPERSGVLIGWKEYVALPELGIAALKAKADTGARTSSLHVAEIRTLAQLPGGQADLELVLEPSRRRPERRVTARVRQLARIAVTDSGGHREVRPVIETLVVLGPVAKRIRVTLTDRATMLFRMILGRKALEGDFVVDVACKYLHPRPRR